jgi:hypothetical protein
MGAIEMANLMRQIRSKSAWNQAQKP